MNVNDTKTPKVLDGFFLSADNDQVQPCIGEVCGSPALRRLGWWYAGHLFMPENLFYSLN